MRALTLFACLAILVTPAAAGPFEGSDDIKAHLEILGYSVEDGEESLIATHDEFYNVAVKPYSGGILVITFFGTSAAAKSDRVGFFEFLNAMNRDAVAARYYEDSEGDVIVEGWYAGEYDRARFGVFMSKFNAVSDQLGDSDIAGRYLGSDSEESDAAAPTTPAEETAKTPSGTRSGERKSDQTGRDSERAGK